MTLKFTRDLFDADETATLIYADVDAREFEIRKWDVEKVVAVA